jgi:hypothetical protein
MPIVSNWIIFSPSSVSQTMFVDRLNFSKLKETQLPTIYQYICNIDWLIDEARTFHLLVIVDQRGVDVVFLIMPNEPMINPFPMSD